jgi:hypothetical protein
MTETMVGESFCLVTPNSGVPSAISAHRVCKPESRMDENLSGLAHLTNLEQSFLQWKDMIDCWARAAAIR